MEKSVRKDIAKLITKIANDYPENDLVAQLELAINLAGYDKLSELTDNLFKQALEDYLDQAEINDLYIETNSEYEHQDEPE